MRTPRKNSLRCWPFWLLVLGWVCANGPQTLLYEAVVWVKGVQTFSHQARLVAEVSQAMAEKAVPAQIASVASENELPRELPAMPAETVIKKLLLAAQSPVQASAPDACGRELGRGFDWSVPAARAVAAPYQPPRGGPLA